MENKDFNAGVSEKEYEERNVMLDEDEPISEDEIQDTILEDSDMNAFQKFVARLDDKTFVLYQRVLGILLGVLTGVALFWGEINGNKEISNYSLIVAVCFALLVPNIVEKQAQRKINAARITMVITLCIVLVAYFLYAGIRTGFNFKA